MKSVVEHFVVNLKMVIQVILGMENKSKKKHTVGLMKPIGVFPTVRRASFIMVRIDATTGAAADVPNT